MMKGNLILSEKVSKRFYLLHVELCLHIFGVYLFVYHNNVVESSTKVPYLSVHNVTTFVTTNSQAVQSPEPSDLLAYCTRSH